MGWSKATKPPSGISYFFVLVFVIVPVLSQIPPGSPVIDGPQVIVLNNQITLTCTSSRGNPAPTVKWFKDDTEITNGISTTTAGTAVTSSLTFTATLDDHLEVYECQAENGVLQNPLTTTKYIEVHFSPVAPVLTGPTTLTPGQQGIWTCVSANGYPAGVMSMRNQNKNTQFTTEFTSNSVLDQKSYDVTGTLTWSPVIVNNGDNICCDVTHTTTLGSTPQTVCRQITVAQPIAINAPVTQYNPILQSTVTLVCDVTQGTANQIIWIKNDAQLNINTNSRLSGGTVATESLTIANVQQSDGGNYVCRGIDAVTGNIVNTDTINVAPVGTPPVTSIPQPSYTQITGQQIILGCTVQSPNSALQEVQWTFTNNQGQTTDPISVSTSNGKYSGSSVNSPSLTINTVASTDQGTYSCKARNLVGTSTNNPTTTLTVTGSLPVVQISPSTYTATYGSQVVINCNIVSASPAATQVYWQRSSNNQILRIDNGDQGYQGSTTSTPSLTINFATTANAGVYTCFATNAVGTGTSNQGTVTITGGLLSVFVTPQNQNVVQGAQQRITCTVSGTPSAQNIAWLFTAAGSNQQTQLNTGNSQKYSLGTTQDPFLTVLNFQPSDAGTYVCRATNAAGSTSSNPGATLTYITVPTTNVEPRQYTATVGDASFQIQCLVTATPGATSWYWTFQPVGGSQQTIAQGTNNNQYTVDNSGTNPHLTIKSIALDEAGIYTCYATNAAGTSDSSNNPSSRHTLTVTGAILTVTISPATANVIRGNTQTIDCNPQGNPAATQITWYFTPSGSNAQQLLNIVNSGGKYNGGTPGNPDLTITDFQTNNAGSYRCAATNAAGTGTSSNSVLTYVDPLSISVTPADGIAIYGDASYTIQCTITGTTPTSSSWSKRPVAGGVVSPISASGKYLIANSANAPHLTINNVVEDDEQDYFCQATNAAGTVTSSRARLIVNGGLLSVAISPSNADVLQGQSQLISCTVTGTPSATAISWRFTPSGSSQQQTISLGNTAKYSGGTTQNPSLTVQNFQSSDGGSYVCSATNAVGTSSSTTSVLRYIQQLTISVSPSDGTAIYGDSSYTIQCSITGTPQATSWSWVRMPISGGGETPISAGTKYSIVNSATAPHLTINNVVEDDEQDYYCRATNVAGTQTSTRARLIVNGGLLSVTISPANADVLQGQSQLITCTVSGIPAATSISWRFTPSGSNQQQTLSLGNTAKYSGGTTQNPSLTVLNFQSSDGGSYVCSATNAVGTSSSTTSVLRYIQQLTISVSPSDGTAVYGTASYTIQCSITGTPQATSWTWQRRPQAGGSLTTISSGSKYSIVNSATAPHLTINNIVESDEQDYFCGATNVAGSQTSSRARLTVTGDLLSVSISPANADVLQGQSQLISCTVSGNPAATSISWRFTPSGSNQQQTLSLGNTAKYSGGNTQNPSLTVLNFQSSDGGTYVCSATNAVGTQSSTTSVLRYIQQLTISVSPSDGTAIYGDSSYTIQCSITGTPQATSWSWVRMPISGGGETPISAGTKYSIVNSATAPHLTINSIVEADEQDYYCRATNVAGTQTSTRARLIVNGDLLSVSISPANADVLQGQSQLITCTVSGNPAATVITWFFTPSSSNQQQTLSLGNTAKYSGGTTQNPSLTVLNFQSSDGGTYVCSATNAVGSQSSTTSILRFIQQLTIAVSPSDGTAVYGTASYTIQCSITGTPQATSWTWQRRPQAGGSLTTISSGNKYSIVNSATAPHLTINNIVEDDEQDYFCGATNVAGTQTSSRARLTVTGDLLSVSISPANADVLQGQSQLITCIVSGNPAATSISWRFTPSGSNQQQTLSLGNTAKYSGGNTQNPSLTVLNFQSSDGGTYVCSATNAVGTRSSTTSVLRYIQQLSVTVSPSDGTAVYGDSSYTIQCSITGTPQATSWTWTRRPTAGGSETTISAGTKYTIVNSATAPHLTINSIVEADEQDYFCAATNVAGSQTSTRARLTVTGELLTVSISPANAEVIRGNSQIITCTVSGNPSVTNVAWTKDGQSVNVAGNPTKYSGGTPGNPSLTVTNFETTDAGSYICIATNAVGSQSSSTSVLTYIEFLSLTVSPSSGSAVLGAQSYVIACQITGNPTATNWYWTKTPSSGGQSENINRNTNNNKYTVQENAQNPQLTIKNIQQSDDANYVCNAQNTAGLRTSSAARLIVTGQLASITASPSTQFANYGANSVTIQCSVSASPSATAVGWRKVSLNGQTSTEIDAQNSNNKYSIVNSLTAPHLTINNVDFNDDSNYVCFATNAVGTGTSNNARVDVIGSAPQVSIPQSAYSVIYGSDITIPCTILNANPAHFRVTWYYTGSNNQQTTINTGDPSQYSGGVLGNPGLTILNANNQDAGFYKCEAENQVNSGQSSNTQLNVIGGALTVTIPSSTYSVLLGNQISITCTVSGSPSATNVYWMKQQTTGGSFSNVDIAGNNRYSGGTLSSPTLVINSAQFSDEGNYRCHGVNAAGDANSIVTNLDVTGSKPVVTIGAPSYSVDYGSSITLVCTVVANPVYTMVSWTKTKAGGSTENVDLSDAAKYSGSRIGSPSLTIRSAVDSDEATYVCSATNSIGQGSSSGTVLNVVGGLLTVTVLQTSYSVLLGNTATLGCSWSGIPSASFITWQKVANNVQRATNNVAADINVGASNGKYVGATVSSPSLIITNVDNDDKAQYICTATNTAGRAYSDRTSLDVTGTIPQVQILQDSYSANYGTSITLDCIVTAVPLHTVVTWRKTKSGTATNINVAASSGKYSGGTVSSPSLVINSANLDDEASYMCSAENNIGIGNSSSTVLDIVGGLLTVTIPTGTYSVQVSNSITIPCILSGLPAATQVRWKKIQNTITTDIDIASGGGKYAGSLTSTPALTIHNAVKSDSANYQCTATNVVGTSSSQETFLSVFGNVPVVQIPARTYSVNFGGNVIIPCSIQANPLHTSVQWKRFTQGTLQDIDITNSGGKFSGSTLNSPDLVINNAVAADETNYICTATNAIGTGQSFSSFLDVIGGLLTVTIPSNQYSVPAGQDIQLVCKVTGTPAAFSVQWKKITVGRSVTQDINIATSNGHYSGSTVDTPSLTIHNAGETDSANYICTATNAAGVAQSQTTNLNVIGDIPTVVILNPPYTVSYGQTITIQCQVTATPSANNIMWTKTINGVDTLINVASSNGKYSGSTVDNPSLTITNTNIKNDEGNYVCSATNSLGTGQSASVFLDVIGGLLTVNVPQAKYTVQQGSSIQMVCSWSGTPRATAIVWKKYILGVPTDISVTNGNGKYGGSTVTSPSLTISNADQSDKATYVCTATNAEGTSNSQPVNLEVTGGVPVVRVKQSAYTVNHGSFVILECTVTANPTHTTVQWYRIINGNPVNVDISKTDKYSGSTVSNPSLTVLSASNADEGNYVCSATNSVGTSQSSQTFLDVLGDILTVNIPQSQYQNNFGTNATLTCLVTGSPPATNVYWTKSHAGGTSTNIDMTNTNKYGGSSVNNPSLLISKVDTNDEGDYICWATNAVGTAQSSSTNLKISGNVPTVTLTTTLFPVLVGNDITIGCNVISNPGATNVYWRFENSGSQITTISPNSNTAKYGGSTTTSPSLVIKNVDFSDAGKYTCYATNSIGTGNSQEGTLQVSGQPPNVVVTLPNYSVDFGQQVTLGCTVTANPAHTSVYWTKNKNGIVTNINVANSGGKYSGSTVGSPSLTITNSNLDDQASYICNAQNSVGLGSSSSTVLTVSGNIPIVTVTQNQYNVDYGNTVTLGCTVTANPTHSVVYWQKIKGGVTSTIDANAISNNARLSGSTVNSPSLVITNVNLDDIASYICFAQNSVGTGQSQQTNLAVSGALPTVVVLSNSYPVTVGGTVTLQCVVNANPGHTVVQWKRIVNGQTQDVTGVGAPGSGSRLSGSAVTSPSLTVSQASFADEGSYICTATNAIGQGSSSQTFLDVTGNVPTVQVTQSEFQGDFGQSVTLGCTVTANPSETRVYWKVLDSNGALQNIDTAVSRYSGSVVGSPSLIISGLNKADQAFYQCFADNDVGTGQSSQTFLRVLGEVPAVTTPATHQFTLGTTATLSCTVNANPAATSVSWSKYNNQNQLVAIDMGTNNNQKYQGSTVGNPSLTILNTVSGDAGRYVCSASNAVGTGNSGTSTLDITGALPIVNIPQSTYAISIGNQITLGCTVSATPKETAVFWTRQYPNAGEITVSKVNSAKYQGQTVSSPSLIILNTDFNDIATYRCYATNTVGTGSSNPTSLTVSGNVPSVVIPLSQYSVNFGSSATIPCTVTANPTHTSVQWKIILNGQEQNVDMQNNKYSGGTVNSPALVIANAQQGDETFYICTAANSVGAGRSIQTFLRVAGDRPQVAIGSSTYQVQKYGTVELVCTITANPAANTVQWYRYDGGVQTSLRNVAGKYNTPTVNSPNLQIINADLSDRGYYICTAANIVGTGTSSSTFVDVTGNEPIVTIPLPNYNGQFGGNVELTCNVVANPSATVVYWTKTVGGQTTTIGQSTGKYSFSVNSPSLMISNLDASDKASYTCYATNSIGNGNSQPTTLDVIGSIPQVTVPATVSVNIGSTATLTCSIQANPTHNSISWQRIDGNNQATTITIDNNKYSGATVNNPTLTITNVQMSDRVNYVCFATNSVGTGQSGSLFLNVQGNPPVVSIASDTYQAPWGNSVTLVCTVTANPTHTSVSWKKIQNGVVTNIVPSNNPSKYEGSTVSSPSLIIKNADRNSDQAFYECAATNTIGTGTSSRTFLTVTGDIPVVQIPDNYQVEIGQSVVVVCTVTSNPAHTTVQWKRVNNNQETNLDISDSSQYQNGNLQNPSLTILNAATDDEGYYRCTATNSVGTGTSALSYVDVTGNILQVTVPQNIYNVNYGQSVQLVCTVTGSPAVTDVYWVKVRNSASTTIRATTMDNSKYSGVSLNNPSLTILNANQDDIAVYKCYGRNVVGLGESQQTQLNVIGSRPAVNVDTSVSVTLGNSVTLQCTVIATPSATMVRWNKVSSSGTSTPVDVTNNPTKYAGGSLSVPSLTIYNAQNTDESTYTCQATNAVGTTVSSQVNLDVVGTIPQVNIGQSQYSVTIGQTITLICTVTANPAHTIVYWRRNVNGVFTDLQSSNRYTGSSVSNPSLTITNTVAGDIGDYKCYATNSVGTGESAQTLLNVVGSAPVVNVASNAYSVNIGNSITLQCNVQANPFHTSVKWQRVDVNGNAVDIDMTNSRYTGSEVNSPSLVISQTMKSDEGRYVCLATNAVGTGQSQQTYLTVVGSTPTVTVDQPQYSANKGSDITLQCSYTANPAATMVRWERANGNTVVEIGDTTNNNKYGGSTVSSPSLIIYNAEESDEGVYKCKVTNSVGTGISTTTNLDVVGNIPIVTVPTSAYTVNVDGSITLACQVTADPTHTQVYWQKVTGGNTQTITINGGKYTGSSVNVPGLTISNAQFADAGTYYCFARNSVGTGSSTQVVLAVSGNTPSVSLTQNAMTVNYGNNVTIGCVVSANPSHTSVYWQKISGGNTVTIDMSNTNKYGGGTVASPSLNIIRADTSDAANYVCFAANSVGTGQSSQGTLTVAGSVPVVTIPQNQYTINVGTDMTIPCNIQSNPQHTQVYWTKKVGNSAAQNIPQGTSDYGGGNVNSPSLIIYNVEEADEAQYNCFAVNIVGTGSASSPTFLNVIGNPPVVTASIPNSVRLGDPVTITCVVTANPGATQIRWKFITNNAESVIDINNNNRYTGGTVQTPSLTISPVEEVDRGSYKCEATNAEGTASSSPVFLNTVGDPPTNLAINPSPITVEEGEVITATCSATGNPNPTFEWRKLGSDNVISNSPVLTINNAQESHKGTYICKAINTMGSGEVQTTVTVHFKPKVTITTTPVQGKKGQSVEIPCEFTSNPFATSVIWTKIVGGQSSQLNLNGNKYQGATVTHPSLTILDLQASDIADYRCSVLNNVGVGNSNIGRVDVDLTVAPFGIMITPNGITVLEGKDFSMFCNATANPSPQYEWYHKDTKVGDGQTYTVQNSIWTPHDGLYTCKAFNSAGEQQATIDVDVKYIPVSAVTTNSFSQGLNSPITLSCDTLANPSAISWQWKYNSFILDGQTEKLYTVDMNNEQDAGQYTCIAYNEVGHSADIHFSVTVGSGVTPGTGASVASAGLTGGEIAAICLGILFFILLLIVLCVCCILQGCCAMCFGAGAGKDKERRITPDHEKLDIPRFYEVPTVVTREPSMISKRDVYVDTVPMAYGAARPQNDYEITKYRVVRPEYDVGERYVTHSAASRPYYLPAIEYTYDEEERRRRRRKKKKSRHHQDELRGDEQIVLEERVVSNGGGDIYRTTSSRTGNDVEVIAGPEYYFEAE